MTLFFFLGKKGGTSDALNKLSKKLNTLAKVFDSQLRKVEVSISEGVNLDGWLHRVASTLLLIAQVIGTYWR